ncbi:hypothetical protein F5Y12DRAFT_762794 [Xylaria sp. FL1777]|nr:hypothetical protein F5Y12DRAFT_762794 [Xylaria sp. FL1777]
MISQCLAYKYYLTPNGVQTGTTSTGLGHGPLYGLARIIKSEHLDVWGALINTDTDITFSLTTIKYV